MYIFIVDWSIIKGFRGLYELYMKLRLNLNTNLCPAFYSLFIYILPKGNALQSARLRIQKWETSRSLVGIHLSKMTFQKDIA